MGVQWGQLPRPVRQLPWLAHHKDLPPRTDASPVPPIIHSMLPNSGRIPCTSNPHPMRRMDVRHFGAATERSPPPHHVTTPRGAVHVLSVGGQLHRRVPRVLTGARVATRSSCRTSALPKASSSSSSFTLCVIRAPSRGPSCGYTVRRIIATEEPVRWPGRFDTATEVPNYSRLDSFNFKRPIIDWNRGKNCLLSPNLLCNLISPTSSVGLCTCHLATTHSSKYREL